MPSCPMSMSTSCQVDGDSQPTPLPPSWRSCCMHGLFLILRLRWIGGLVSVQASHIGRAPISLRTTLLIPAFLVRRYSTPYMRCRSVG